MNAPMDAQQRRLRWSGLLLGSILLFWLPIEDTNLTAATILSAAVCFWIVLTLSKKWNIHSRQSIWAGFAGGFAVGPVGFMLMVLKIGFHHHTTPDFSMDQLLRLIKISPVWALSGFLLSWGLHLYRISRS